MSFPLINRRFIWALFLFFPAGVAFSAEALQTELIDIPTADVVDLHGYSASFRFYTDGGLLSKTNFGVFQRLNVGFGLDAEKFVGNRTIDLNRPTLNVRFRFFDGQRQLPALALGYDGQGYFFNHATDKYAQREKGLYIVGSGEVFVPDLTLHGGGNIFDFRDDKVFAFSGINYFYQNVFGATFEWDNVRIFKESRFNVGGRYYVTSYFSIDLAGRDLWSSRKPERIVRLTYTGSF